MKDTVCPRSSDPFCVETYYIRCVTYRLLNVYITTIYATIFNLSSEIYIMKDTVCPRSSYKVYVTTSWAYG